jgi:hypothetical protein
MTPHPMAIIRFVMETSSVRHNVRPLSGRAGTRAALGRQALYPPARSAAAEDYARATRRASQNTGIATAQVSNANPTM